MSKVSNMHAARKGKNDEFYTQWVDIEREMNAYVEFNPDVFRGKVVLLPCDDPEWSNFLKFFALHFETFGLRRLIVTCHEEDGQGRAAILDHGVGLDDDGRVDLNDLQRWDLDGDGDFRGDEVTALRDDADMVITNPPFSLIREFIDWLVEGEVDFSIVGTNNVITYKNSVPLIMDDQMWLGASSNKTMVFRVPDDYPVKQSVADKVEAMGHTEGKHTMVPGICWFTNIDHGRRHEPLQLMTAADNRRFSKRSTIRDHGYRRYDNIDAIEVPYVEAIPSDHDGVMGVPVTFLTKHNPDQFEIVGVSKQWFGSRTKTYPNVIKVTADGTETKVAGPNDAPIIEVEPPVNGTHYRHDGRLYVAVYNRLLIRHRENGDAK